MTEADRVKTPMAVVKEHLLKHDVFPWCKRDCKQFLLNLEACDKVRLDIQ